MEHRLLHLLTVAGVAAIAEGGDPSSSWMSYAKFDAGGKHIHSTSAHLQRIRTGEEGVMGVPSKELLL